MMTEHRCGAVNPMQFPLFIAGCHQLVNGSVDNPAIGCSIEWCWREEEYMMNKRRRRVRQRKERNLTRTSILR